MIENGSHVWFRIELAEQGFIGTVGGAVVDGSEFEISDNFVATNLGSLWLTAKEKVKELLDIDEEVEE